MQPSLCTVPLRFHWGTGKQTFLCSPVWWETSLKDDTCWEYLLANTMWTWWLSHGILKQTYLPCIIICFMMYCEFLTYFSTATSRHYFFWWSAECLKFQIHGSSAKMSAFVLCFVLFISIVICLHTHVYIVLAVSVHSYTAGGSVWLPSILFLS